METSEHIDKLCAALAAFQGEQGPVLKTAINNAFARGGSGGSKYATLADCADCHKTLSSHGLAFMQGIHGAEFIARLVHASGQWVQLRVPVPGDFSKLTIQQLGAITTYLRRQTYSLVGVVADDDDDGNEANKAGTFQKPEAKPGIGVHSPLGEVQVNDQDRLYASVFIKAVENDDRQAVRAAAADLHDEGEERYRAVWSLLDSKVRSSIKKILADKEAA
jgi:hypothetical protein